jgi:anti-sigma factor RsiW
VTCKDALELVDAIASGDVEVDQHAREHFETCPRCASALASARRVEALLMARAAPPAPARFTQGVVQRIRRERWRAEQQVDWLFNIAIVVAVLVIVGGVVALTNLDGLLALGAATWTLMTSAGGEVARQAAPTLGTYVAAGGLLASTLVVWWWAERKLTM